MLAVLLVRDMLVKRVVLLVESCAGRYSFRLCGRCAAFPKLFCL